MSGEKLLFRLEQPHGTGDVYVAWQNGSGNYLATTGIDGIVNIFDRYGQVKDRIRLTSLCTGFEWDIDGDLLAIICQTSQLTIWDANSERKSCIDIGLKDVMTCLAWSKTSPILAVGTTKGNVSLYNHNTSKRTPIIGKHTKKITCAAWNLENLLALGSEDKSVSVSNVDGDTLRVINLRFEPMNLQFSEMKLDERIGVENTISMVLGKKTLYLYNLLDPENPIELAFQTHYGSIVSYKWFGDGYILIGFSSGYFIAISTHIKEVGQELFQIKNHKNVLTSIATCPVIGKAASCGDNNVKIHELNNLQETSSVISLPQEAGLERISWSVDGQLLAVCTKGGSLNIYVSHMPELTAVCGPRIAILSSLTEVSLYNFVPEKQKLRSVPVSLEIEPVFLAVGPYHLAAGMNNRVWFYDLTRPNPNQSDCPFTLKDQLYLGTVDSVFLNQEYASVLFEGKIQLHLIDQQELKNEDRDTILFPDFNEDTYLISCHAITNEFLIFASDMGHLIYFYIEEWQKSLEYRHTVGITNIYVDPTGTKLVFIDIKGQAYVFNAVTNEAILVPDLPDKITGITWDNNLSDKNVFIVFNEELIFTYIYTKISIYGPTIKNLGQTNLSSKQIPLLLYAGDIISATSGGQLSNFRLGSHDTKKVGEKDVVILEANFHKQLKLHRFSSALSTCEVLKSKKLWTILAEETIKHLEIDLAFLAYKKVNIASVFSLRRLIDIENVNLICGYLCMFLKDFDRAQEWFLSSSKPSTALGMRRDLLQWDQALKLAKKMAPEQIAFLSREYAQQLEFIGNYSEALMHYEKGLQENLNPDHTLLCKAGIARTNLQINNIRHGMSIILELDNKQLNKEGAEIMERKKQLPEAAILFEKCQNYDKAASCYIKSKNWAKVGEILPFVTSGKIHLQYARAKEEAKEYEDAVKAYNSAKDYDSVVRLQLDFLNNPEIAVEIVQETKSVEGAKLVAKFFQRLNDYTSAIRFLVLSKCNDEAYELARKHNKMELYGEILLNVLSEDEIRSEDFSSVALYFENERNYLLAGKYWYHAKDFYKAMKYLLTAAKSNSKENSALTSAIDVVATSKDEILSNQLIEYLLGESDGIPKDPKYLFRLYMAKKQYKEASKSAIIIANEEQINGNYRNAHDVLFAMHQELKINSIKIPQDMYFNLLLLHSYILVRFHVKRGDHYKGARMLIRVANSISKFPSHIVPILTSTVIECHRAGLRFAAFKYASMLMNPEYRQQIDAKYAKKIEAVVRKPPKSAGKNDEKNQDIQEEDTPCPYCENMLPETEVFCNNCKNNIPFCIITGRHITKYNLTACPECDFPALRSEFVEIFESEAPCPMCSEKIDARRLIKIEDPKPYLNLE